MTSTDPTVAGEGAGPGVRRTVEEVDADWLTGVLRASGDLAEDASVTSVDAAPVGTGQVADTLRLTLGYDREGAGPPTLVAKLASQDESSRTTGQMLRIYEVEVRFYQQVSRQVGLHHPRAVAAEVDPATGFFTLLLEDAAPAEQGNDLVGCTADVAEACVRELVLLHAPCWGRDDLRSLEWLDRSTPEHRTFLGMYLGSAWPGFVDRYGDRLQEEDLAVGAAAIEHFAAVLDHPGPTTVIHGDYRLDNMLLHPDDPRPCVVDWQTTTWGPASLDLAYFLGASVTVDVRREHHDRLVRAYHEALGAQGVEGYDLAALETDVARSALAPLYQAVGASMAVVRTDRGDDMFISMFERSAALARDLDTFAVSGVAG
jgi:hypothetical protein